MKEDKLTMQNEYGTITLAPEVIYTLARRAVAETRGVAAGNERWGRELVPSWGKKDYSIGARVYQSDQGYTIDIVAPIEMGYSVKEVGQDIQQKVRERVGTLSGIQIDRVNVNFVTVYQSK